MSMRRMVIKTTSLTRLPYRRRENEGGREVVRQTILVDAVQGEESLQSAGRQNDDLRRVYRSRARSVLLVSTDFPAKTRR